MSMMKKWKTERYSQLGRVLLAVVTNHQVLPRTFAPYVLAYVCGDDAYTLADRAAIGTAGEPSEADAEVRPPLPYIILTNPHLTFLIC